MVAKKNAVDESSFNLRAGPWIAFARIFAGFLLLYELTLGGWWKIGWFTTGPNPDWIDPGADGIGPVVGTEVQAVADQALEEGTYGWFGALLEAVVLPAPELWTALALIAQIGGALALIVGIWTRPAALVTIFYFLPVFHLGMIRTSPLFTVPVAFAFVANAGRYYGVDGLLWNRPDVLGRLTRAVNAPLPIRREWYPMLAAGVAVVGLYYLLTIPEMVGTRVDLTALEMTVFAGLLAGGCSYVYRGANPVSVVADALRVFVGYRFLQEIVVRTEPGANALPGWASADAQTAVFEGIAEAHVAPMASVIELAILPAMSAWVVAFAAVQTAVGIALLVGYRTRLAGTVAVAYLAVLTALGLVRLAPLVFASAIVAATLAGRHASLDAIAGRDVCPPTAPARVARPAAASSVALLVGAAVIGIDPTAGYGDVAGPVALVMIAFGLLALAAVSSPSTTSASGHADASLATSDD
ncbi:DoxX family protein [Natronolimnohabitans sp. A-GB9]|uniref:DoxX family protein n=1 Tax=Natronolimnohabitans sp. A-GB9 TaxID=3069757 RepID=UPI0027AF3B35|nr:DoxX family protein [Natronolimnohabitans sp. A-GB9]MDQ2052547.1 DoxX family protein [Natronolimnohabitans sp. A-GB9]